MKYLLILLLVSCGATDKCEDAATYRAQIVEQSIQIETLERERNLLRAALNDVNAINKALNEKLTKYQDQIEEITKLEN